MEEKKSPPKKPEVKAKAKVEAKPKEAPMLINWKAAAQAIEKEMEEAGWNSAKQRRRPRFLFGLVSKHIIRPLVEAIHKKGA